MNKDRIWLIVAIPAFFGLFQIIFALYHYPLLGDDSIAFLPAAINYSEGNGLTNSTYSITRLLNIGQAEVAYVNYPPVFPLIHGYLLFFTNNLHLNAAIIHIVSMTIFSFLVFHLNQVFKMPGNKLAWLLFLFLAAWNTQLNPGEGRPETLAQLWILLLVYTLLVSNQSYIHILSGFLIGITGFTHPVGGIYVGLICILVFLYKNYAWQKYLQLIIGGITGFLFLIIIYPFPIARLINGISEHGKIVADRSLHSAQSFIYYHLTSPYVSFYFLIFLAGVFGWILFLWKKWNSIHLKFNFISILLLFFFALFYFSFQTMEASYNLYILLPLFGLGIFYLASLLKRNFIYFFLLFILIIGATGFARRTLLFGVHINKGLRYEEAKNKLKNILSANKNIAVSSSFYSLPPNITLVTDNRSDLEVQYFLLQQNFTGLSVPPEVPGFQLIENQFSTQTVQLAGFKLASSAPGYQYALYKRIASK